MARVDRDHERRGVSAAVDGGRHDGEVDRRLHHTSAVSLATRALLHSFPRLRTHCLRRSACTVSPSLSEANSRGGEGEGARLPPLALAIFSASRLFPYIETLIFKKVNLVVPAVHVFSEHSSTPWHKL